MKFEKWDKKYLNWGITAFCVIAASILFFLILHSFSVIGDIIGKFFAILSPFIWGLVIAYLLSPLMKIYEDGLFGPLVRFARRKKNNSNSKKNGKKLIRGLSVLLTVISLLIILTALVWLIVPQLYSSVESIVVNSPTYYKAVVEWIEKLLADFPEVETAIEDSFGNISESIMDWLKNSILPLISNVTSGLYSFAKSIYNIIIGIIVSVYVLADKETFGAYAKKLIYCVFKPTSAKKVITGVEFADSVFIGFLSGKILDSAIIGVMCYVGCIILKMPYALLVSFIVGVTNIIPFFGPIIGMIPSAVIILMLEPIKAVIFLVFVIILQQFDGNILGPKILGDSVGVNGFWIMFSIIIGSGLFGFAGMLLGVPVFVLIYTLIRMLVNRKLEAAGLPIDTDIYRSLRFIDPESKEPVAHENTPKATRKSNGKKKLIRFKKSGKDKSDNQ